ncbi:hypothetical protein DFP72DRAFT_1049826 [Ephemerocybe angulata]|uniref:Uncharacterized protein n=1 Tax=Ephemerocybe angulata TaxID=980116 RepID=A0A8H6HJ81_9AGAR|nr:hypothetical protein DFP72DRAFT_1049826 [Tulosesus angulatus]
MSRSPSPFSFSSSSSSAGEEEAPILEFFSQHTKSGFEYDPSQPSSQEFKRLCDHNKWKPSQPESKVAKTEFSRAIIQQFNVNFGKDEKDLYSWQKLCQMVSIDPIPDTVEEAREAFESVNVNLVELTDGYSNGQPVKTFDTVQKLSRYTLNNNLIFPKQMAYQEAGGLLKCLLRNILNPSKDVDRGRGSSVHRRAKERRGGKRAAD